MHLSIEGTDDMTWNTHIIILYIIPTQNAVGINTNIVVCVVNFISIRSG